MDDSLSGTPFRLDPIGLVIDFIESDELFLWRLALAFLIVLGFGVFAWWRGRRLIARIDGPAIPELLWKERLRNSKLIGFTAVAIVGLAHWSAVWVIPLLLVAYAVGSFPLRKAVYRESWGILRSLRFQTAILVVMFGFWPVVGLAPLAMQRAGAGHGWWMAWVLLLLFVIGYLLGGKLGVRVLGAKPFDLATQPELAARIEDILARSTARRPDLYRLDLGGGFIVNAIAFPFWGRPAVAFTDSLLSVLRPAEVAAIHAHEVAHLEYYTPVRLLRGMLVAIVLFVLSISLIPLIRYGFGPQPWLEVQVCFVWYALLAFGMKALLSRKRALETASDLRALELCSDADALIEGLKKIHQTSLQPRRLSGADTRQITHPSLAQRLQAIRVAAQARTKQTLSAQPPPLPVPSLVLPMEGSKALLLEPTCLVWLDGIAPDIPADPQAVRAAAASVREVPYSQLRELRLEASLDRPASLVVVDLNYLGRWIPVPAEMQADLQRALDRIDSLLAPAPAPANWRAASETRLPAQVFPRLAAFVALVSALMNSAATVILIPSILVLIWPQPGPFLALGLCSLAVAFPPPASLAAHTLGGTGYDIAARVALIAVGLTFVSLGMMKA